MSTIQKDQNSSPEISKIKVYTNKTIVKQPEILNKKFPIKILNDRLVDAFFTSKRNFDNQKKVFTPQPKLQLVNVKLKDQPTANINIQQELSQINKSKNLNDVSITAPQNNENVLSTSTSTSTNVVSVKLKDQPTVIFNIRQEQLSQINNKSENLKDVLVTTSQNNEKVLSTSVSTNALDVKLEDQPTAIFNIKQEQLSQINNESEIFKDVSVTASQNNEAVWSTSSSTNVLDVKLEDQPTTIFNIKQEQLSQINNDSENLKDVSVTASENNEKVLATSTSTNEANVTLKDQTTSSFNVKQDQPPQINTNKVSVTAARNNEKVLPTASPNVVQVKVKNQPTVIFNITPEQLSQIKNKTENLKDVSVNVSKNSEKVATLSSTNVANVKLKDQPTAIFNSKQEQSSQINNKSENLKDVSATASQNNDKVLSTPVSTNEDDEELDVEVRRDPKTGKKTLVFKKKYRIENNVKNDGESSVKNPQESTSNNDKIEHSIAKENNEDNTKIEENVNLISLPTTSTMNHVKCLESNPKMIVTTKDLSQCIISRKTTQLLKPSKSTPSTQSTSKVKNHFVFESVCVPIGEKKLYSRRPKTPEHVYRKFNLPVPNSSNNCNQQSTVDEQEVTESSENLTKTSETMSEQQQRLIVINNPNQKHSKTTQPISPQNTGQVVLAKNNPPVPPLAPIPIQLRKLPQLQPKKLPALLPKVQKEKPILAKVLKGKPILPKVQKEKPLLPKVQKEKETKVSSSKDLIKNSSDPEQNPLFKYKFNKNSQPNIISPLNQIVVLQKVDNSNNFQPVVLQKVDNLNNFQPVVLQKVKNPNNFHPVVLQNVENANNFHPVVLQNGQNSNNFRQVVLQKVENSNNFHPVVLQTVENSNNFSPVVLQNGQISNNFHQVVLPTQPQPQPVKQKSDANDSSMTPILISDEDTVTNTNVNDHNYTMSTLQQQKVFTETLKSKSIYNLTSELKSKFIPLIGHACTATIIDNLGMAYSRCRNSHVTALRDLIQYVDNFKKYRRHKTHDENTEIYENETAVTNQNVEIQDTLRETNTVSTQTDLSNDDLNKKLTMSSQATQEISKNQTPVTNQLPITDLLLIYREWKNATVADPSGNMPIHRAVMENDLESVKRQCVILKNMNKINIQNKSHHRTALHVAVMFQVDMDIVNLLLSCGVNPELQDMSGDNCIHLAVRYGSAELIDFILKTRNFDTTIINTYNFNGFTPLMLCAEHNKYEIAKILLDNYANPNIQNPKSGRTVLFQAIEYNDHPLVKLLIKHGADLKKRDFSGVAPQDAAAELDTEPDIRHAIFKLVSQNIVSQQRKRQRNFMDEQSVLLQSPSGKFRKIDENFSISFDVDVDDDVDLELDS